MHFVSGFFCSTLCLYESSIVSEGVVHSLSLPYNIPLHECHNLFIYSLADGHLDYFQFIAIEIVLL